MLVVGELINTSRQGIQPAVADRDAGFIGELARRQVAAGATYVDVNAGTLLQNEPAALAWLVQTVQEAVDVPLCIDSPNPLALEAALKVHRGKALINSISAEKDRYERIIPLVQKYAGAVVALCMGDNEMPSSTAERVTIAEELLSRLTASGVARDDIYFDPLVQPISVSTVNGRITLDSIEQIKSKLPGVHTICGLSNISFGLPNRKLLNRNLLVMAMERGLDAVICDPLDQSVMSALRTAAALLGHDEYCLNYIASCREGIAI